MRGCREGDEYRWREGGEGVAIDKEMRKEREKYLRWIFLRPTWTGNKRSLGTI